ncbi:MAG: alpha-L-rhamnosidase [Acidobacteria bacterium]|nr:MAG: alpha-L-rhamnosidase [Acidobacteriota bacterium]
MARGPLQFPAPESWVGQWVEPAETGNGPRVQRPAYYLAAEFYIAGDKIDSAVLFATSHGVYEAFINGKRVGDFELTPGFTAYRKRVQVQQFDVTDLLSKGANAWGAVLSDGWWRGQHGVVRGVDAYGSKSAFLAELHVLLASGEVLVFGTGPDWRSKPSHILAADLICGEVHDNRQRVKAWIESGTDRSDWSPVTVGDYGYDELVPMEGPPVRRIEELDAESVTEIAPGRFVVDFGQNSNGWIRISDLGPEGNEIVISYGEWLDPDGDVIQANVALGPFAPPSDEPPPFQTDRAISAGEGDSFEPRHSTKGFRYVRVEGYEGELDCASLKSVVVHSDLPRVGGFRCSNERINRLHTAAEWSFRSNACDIPTDCPTRERSGWVGDWQTYVAAALYLYDVSTFSAKWLADLAADQLENGAVTNIVPDPSPDAPLWKEAHGSSGWGDAAVHVPWEVYLATGETGLLGRQYESMKRWVDFAAASAAGGRHRSRIERSAEPLEHERYLWDTGWHFGEWLEPGVDMDQVFPTLAIADHGPVATAYLSRSAGQLARIAELLGDGEAAQRYAKLSANARDAWRTEFIDADGRVTPATQANLVRALAFGLLPEASRDQAAEDLVVLIREAGNHLGTGFLSTVFLLPVLADHGHLDVAYDLLYQDTEPSWMYMIDTGGTTIWEDWDGVKPDGTVSHSLNHYGKGSVISFLHGYIGGLQLIGPGWRRFRVAPKPHDSLDWAETYHTCPFGTINARWESQGGAVSVEVDVPGGTVAEVIMPSGEVHMIEAGKHKFCC